MVLCLLMTKQDGQGGALMHGPAAPKPGAQSKLIYPIFGSCQGLNRLQARPGNSFNGIIEVTKWVK